MHNLLYLGGGWGLWIVLMSNIQIESLMFKFEPPMASKQIAIEIHRGTWLLRGRRYSKTYLFQVEMN